MVFGGEVNVANKYALIELWHKRLGHVSQKGLDVLARKIILSDIKGMHLETCVDFLVNKQHKVAF